MPTDTAYRPGIELLSSSPIGLLDLDPETSQIRAYPEGDLDSLTKDLLDTLACSLVRVGRDTFAYRWIGTDSLNWGNPSAWAQILWIKCLAQGDVNFGCLKKYGDLRAILLDSRVSSLEQESTFRQPEPVRTFIKEHLVLLDTLPLALSVIRRIFGDRTPVEFDVTKDPEGVGPDSLFAYIISSLDPKDALILMDRLDSDWYLSQPASVLEIFNITLDFV